MRGVGVEGVGVEGVAVGGVGVSRGEAGGVTVGVFESARARCDTLADLEVVADVGVGVGVGSVGVGVPKRASVTAMGEVESVGQVASSSPHPSSCQGSRTRYAPNVPSPAPVPLSTYTYSVARKTSVPGGNTSSGKSR